MDAKTKRLFSFMLYFGLAVGALILCFNAADSFCKGWIAYSVFTALMIAHNVLFLKNKTSGWPNALCIALALMLALCVQYFDRTGFTGFSVMIVVVVALLIFKLRVSIPIAAAAIAASIALYYLSQGFPRHGFWSSVGTIFLPRLVLIFAITITHYSISVSMKNRELAESLRQKAGELEDALTRLRVYTEELKETAELRAKDQLMRVLHDRLGHMLATASISAQAAAVLVDRDPPAAKARLEMASEQIQAAMRSLREVLTGGTDGTVEQEPVFGEIVRLARETEMRTGIPIHIQCASAVDFDALPLSQCSFLYNALMEGLTNGIRHGHVTRFDLSLIKADGRFRFSLRDNGTGFREIRYGYGLTKIERDARRFGGSLEMDGADGCEMRILLPLESLQTTEESHG